MKAPQRRLRRGVVVRDPRTNRACIEVMCNPADVTRMGCTERAVDPIINKPNLWARPQ